MLSINLNNNTCYRAKTYAFTLAEMIITLTLLGIVAAIAVPSTIKQSTNRTKKTKIAKALSNYNRIIENSIIENDLQRKEAALNNFFKNDENCSNSSKYFKISKYGANKCTFRTVDGLWWDIGSNATATKALVAFKEADLTGTKAADMSTNDAFYFVSAFDKSSQLRVMDLQYGKKSGSGVLILNPIKVNAFINNKDMSSYLSYCNETQRVSCVYRVGGMAYMIDENGNTISTRSGCDADGIVCQNSGISNIWSQKTGANDYADYGFDTTNGWYYAVSANCDLQGDNCTGNKNFFVNGNLNTFSQQLSNLGISYLFGDKGINDSTPIYSVNYSGCDHTSTDLSKCTSVTTMEQYNRSDGVYRFNYNTKTKEYTYTRSQYFNYNGGKLEFNVEVRYGCKNSDCSIYTSKVITTRDENGLTTETKKYDCSKGECNN